MSKATNIELIEQSEYIDVYRLDYGVVLRVLKCTYIKSCYGFNKRKAEKLAKNCYRITTEDEIDCAKGDVILEDFIVKKVDNPKDYIYELKISGGTLPGNAISMTWYTNMINEIISKYNKSEEYEMSKIKDTEGNIELKRRLIFIDGMANTLLKQMKDLKLEVHGLTKYSEEDIKFYIDEIMEINNKIFQVREIIDGK